MFYTAGRKKALFVIWEFSHFRTLANDFKKMLSEHPTRAREKAIQARNRSRSSFRAATLSGSSFSRFQGTFTIPMRLQPLIGSDSFCFYRKVDRLRKILSSSWPYSLGQSSGPDSKKPSAKSPSQSSEQTTVPSGFSLSVATA